MNRVLIAVLSTRHDPWGPMVQQARDTWDSVDVEGVETIFYTGAPASALADRLIGFPVEDDYLTIYRKNLYAYEWLLRHRGDWDIMCRVNASTYVHKERLMEYCQSLPTEGLVRGARVHVTDRAEPWMWGGYNFIFSRDVVADLVDHPGYWPRGEMEDVQHSAVLHALGYSFDVPIPATSIEQAPGGWRLISTVGEGGDFDDFATLADGPHFLFRCKQDGERHRDGEIMRALHDQHTANQGAAV